MKPEEKRELEEVAGRIERSNRLRGIIAGIVLAVVIISVNVVATSLLTAEAIAERQQIATDLAERADHNAAVTVAAERGLRCVLRVPSIPPEGPRRQKVFNDCYREFDRLAEQEDGS